MACIVAGNSPSVFGSCKSSSIHDSDIEIWASFLTPMTNDIQASFMGSKLSSFLTIKDENILWSESGKSPVKRTISLCVNVPEENGSIAYKCPSPLLKWKCPMMLAIPLQKSDLNVRCVAVEQSMDVNVEHFHYAVSCKKIQREFMEDNHQTIVNVRGHSKHWAFFCLFDGHSNGKAAAFTTENIGQNIVDAMLDMGDKREDILEHVVRIGYLTKNAEFLKQEVGGGNAYVTTLIIDGNLVVSNVGDCRAVITKDGVFEALTCDHRVGREDERK